MTRPPVPRRRASAPRFVLPTPAATRRRRRLILGLRLAFAAVVSLVLAIGVVWFHGLAEAASEPIVRRARIVIAGPALKGQSLRLALLSDIHIGNRAMPQERLARIVDQVNAERPDVVLLAGDYVNGHLRDDPEARPDLLTAPLAHLHAPLGVFAVPGNHDHYTNVNEVNAALARAGIIVLINTAWRAGPLAIAGIDDVTTLSGDRIETMDAARRIGGLPVVLTHNPAIARWLPADAPLVLAGHTHCGQVQIPWLLSITEVPLVRGALFDPHYRCGMIRDPGRTTIVTAGLGSGSFPIRLGAPPDFWVITLSGE